MKTRLVSTLIRSKIRHIIMKRVSSILEIASNHLLSIIFMMSSLLFRLFYVFPYCYIEVYHVFPDIGKAYMTQSTPNFINNRISSCIVC